MKDTCPKCQFSFIAKDHLKNGITGPISLIAVLLRPSKSNPFEEFNEAIKTVCPNCNHEYPYKDYKFFGFIDRKSLWLGYAIALIIFLLAGIYFLAIKPTI